MREFRNRWSSVACAESRGHGAWATYVHDFFFFSSRRRHTRFDCDWSSDVCSSDLAAAILAVTACQRPLKPGDPLRGLSAAERARFDQGKGVFDSVFTPETGLGPLFNANACAECHEDPVAGGTGDEVDRHATAFHEVGPAGVRQCDELAAFGGPVYQNHVTPALHTALGIDSEPVPPVATAVAAHTIPD